MVWRIKGNAQEPKEIKETVRQPLAEEIPKTRSYGQITDDIEAEKQDLKERLQRLEESDKRAAHEEKPVLNKQELIDVIQGNLERTARLIEILRGI